MTRSFWFSVLQPWHLIKKVSGVECSATKGTETNTDQQITDLFDTDRTELCNSALLFLVLSVSRLSPDQTLEHRKNLCILKLQKDMSCYEPQTVTKRYKGAWFMCVTSV